jgi:hypothetical protein
MATPVKRDRLMLDECDTRLIFQFGGGAGWPIRQVAKPSLVAQQQQLYTSKYSF